MFLLIKHIGDICPLHSFMCANDDCIPASRVCDGIADCEDNSDEMHVCKGKLHTSMHIPMHQLR